MNTSPETQAVNLLVEQFDALTGYRHDTWSLVQILAWFEGFRAGAKQKKDKTE